MVSAREAVDEVADELEKRVAEGEGVFPPGTPRLDDVEYLYKNSRAQGIIHATLSFCTPYLLEQGSVKRFAAEHGIPLVAVETDYSEGDVGQLKTRFEALIEQVRP